MRYLKKFESLYDSSLILELKDMALELTDIGFNIQIFKDGVYNQDDKGDSNIRLIIIKNNFTIKTIKDFLLRVIGYMKDNGYDYDSNSNFGSLNLTEDYRIILSSGEVRDNYPGFTMINILFKK